MSWFHLDKDDDDDLHSFIMDGDSSYHLSFHNVVVYVSYSHPPTKIQFYLIKPFATVVVCVSTARDELYEEFGRVSRGDVTQKGSMTYQQR